MLFPSWLFNQAHLRSKELIQLLPEWEGLSSLRRARSICYRPRIAFARRKCGLYGIIFECDWYTAVLGQSGVTGGAIM